MPYQPAVLGSARLANFRLNYLSAALAAIRETRVVIVIDDVNVTPRVRRAGFTIQDEINDSPNTASFRIEDPAPTVGETVRITLNATTPRLLFNGTLEAVDLTYEGRPAQLVWACSAQDDQARVAAMLPYGTWTNTSATTVVQALVATFAPAFTATHVQASLAPVSVSFDSSEGFGSALSQIAKLVGGYFYWDDGDLHFFLTEATDVPDPIDDSHPFLDAPPITVRRDKSQLRTRVYGKGHGEPLLDDVVAGATILPVANADAWFSATGGRVLVDTQRLTYTGVRAGYWAASWSPWVTRTAPSTGGDWRSLVWAPALGLFVAVSSTVGGGTVSDVMTSANGITWTLRTPAAVASWRAVTWSPDLARFVAVGASVVMTSPDGITWTTRTAAAANTWEGVCWAPGLSLFVAVARDGTNRAMTSPDGITWTIRTTPGGADYQWQDVTWAPALGLLAAVSGTAGINAIMTSPDGITWTIRTTPVAHGGFGIAWAPTLARFVAVGQEVMWSADGVTWISVTTAPANTWVSVIWVAEIEVFVAVATDVLTDPGHHAMTSPDGLTWTVQATPIPGTWASVAWAPSLGLLAAVAAYGAGSAASDPRLMTSHVDYDKLVGIPASGTGAITRDLIAGTTVNIWVQRDDLTAQTAIAAAEGTTARPSTGVYEYLVSDERRNETSLTAVCDAYLTLYKAPIATVQYDTRDVKTKSGKPIVVDLASPVIDETLTIQSVTITELDIADRLAPRFHVTASSVKYTLEALLRSLTGLVQE